MITVFTPTYNRAYTLERLYRSLQSQTVQEFEWIVIDDGSTDNTEELIANFKKENNMFSIRYEKVENGGKHRAINRGVELAKGELFYIVDSDDLLPSESLEMLLEISNSIEIDEKENFAGVCGQKGNLNQTEIGSTFTGDVIDITYLETRENGISGDKAEVYYTEILKKFPFPEFDDEKFIPESVVWNRIGETGLKLRYFNKIIYCCEYLDDGLTKQGIEKLKNIPKGYGLYLSQSIRYGKLRKLKKWETILEYYNMFCEKYSIWELSKNLDMNPVKLYFRILGMRLFYKLYNR